MCAHSSPYLTIKIQIHLHQQLYHNIITQNDNSRIKVSPLKITTAVSQYHHSKWQQSYHSIITRNDNSRITISSLKMTTKPTSRRLLQCCQHYFLCAVYMSVRCSYTQSTFSPTILLFQIRYTNLKMNPLPLYFLFTSALFLRCDVLVLQQVSSTNSDESTLYRRAAQACIT
jgi:hypothetical protein